MSRQSEEQAETEDGSVSTDEDGEATDATSGAEGNGAEESVDAVDDQLLVDGAQVYSQICSSCHQPGGAGLPGQFPPLLGNPHVEDGDYVRQVIDNGRQGEIVVGDHTYDGVMPALSTLADDDVDAVVAYVRSGFATPDGADEAAPATPGGPVAGTELPVLADVGAAIAYLLAASVILMVLAPRITGANDRLRMPWLDAWLKTAVIVLTLVLTTVVVPDWALQSQPVAELDRPVQDLIGSGLWALGLVGCLAALWYAHRGSRI